MKVNVEKQQKSTLKISVSVESAKVKETYDKVLMDVVKETEIAGFRKGKAPKEKVLENTDVSKLYGEVVNELLRVYYPQALKEKHISPVSNPKVEITEFDLEKDFEFNATVAVRPEIKIGDYKKEIKKLKDKKIKEQEKALKEENAERLKNGEALKEVETKMTVDDVIDGIVESTTLEVSDLLVDEETDRMMSRLINQAQSVGMTLEDYLKAQNKSGEDLRKQYMEVAERNLKAEFALNQLIQDKKIEITDKEVEDMVNASGDEEAKKQMQDKVQQWYIKSILAKNKVLTDILEEVNEDSDKKEDKKKEDK